MTLLDEATLAEDVSDALTKYRKPNPEHVQNINAAIAELAGLSWALREIDRLLEEYGDNLYIIEDDLKIVHESVSFTLADVWSIIGSLGGKLDTPLTDEDFRRNWRKIARYCRDRGRQEFSTRLDTYKRFLLALCRNLTSPAPAPDDFRALRRDVREIAGPPARRLLIDTDQPFEQAGEAANRALGAPAAGELATRRSYERQRGPLSPSESGSSTSPFAGPFNLVPSPPMSPTNTYSTMSQISSVDQESEHWALQLFRDIPSFSPLPGTNERSRYHDVPNQPSQGHPGDNYDEVAVMSFPPDPPGLRVSFYCRRRDWRSKLVADWKDIRGRPCVACLPLNALKVFRKGPMLHFCRRLPDGETNLAWLSVKFTTPERLVLFACTFLSMRSHDGKKSVKPADDWEFEGEKLEYGGKIQENGYSHAIRIYRDRVSQVVRLQASVCGGLLDNTPVWTAFITHSITSRTWCQRERNIVCLRELRPLRFSSEFEFQRLSNGAFVLDFESREDAKEFSGCIEDLGREYRRARA